MTAIQCRLCHRGREACQWCALLSDEDYEAMCDCGLYDFGYHLLGCQDRADKKYVVAADYEGAELPREGSQ